VPGTPTGALYLLAVAFGQFPTKGAASADTVAIVFASMS
jgi:hypothetical protein